MTSPRDALRRVVLGLAVLLASTFVAAPQAAEATVTPPDQPGPFAVGYANTSFWCNGWYFSARIYYPANSAGQNATMSTAGKPYPGVVVAPASFIGFDKITWITTHLASHGFVVLGYNRPNILDLTTNTDTGAIGCGITKLISENTNALSKVKGGVDTAKLGAAGISLGGAAVLRKAPDDSRIKAVVALTPGYPNTFGDQPAIDQKTAQITVPTQIQSGEMDCVSPGGGLHYYGLIGGSGAKEWLEIADGNHTKFTDPGGDDPSFSGGTCPVSSLSTSAQQVIARKYATAWFGYYLKGNTTDYATYVTGADIHDAQTSGVLSGLQHT
jgi:predicted dienelactone hydrolase